MQTLSGNWYIDGPLIAAALLTAYVTIWRRFVKPTARFVKRLFDGIIQIADATPILIDIAREFQPNSGSTLRDTIDQMQTEGNQRRAQIETLETEMERRHQENRTQLDQLATAVRDSQTLKVLSVEAKVGTAVVDSGITPETKEAP